MYYKFSGLTQKLVGAVPTEAYNPQGLRPTFTEAPVTIFATPTKLATESAATSYLGDNRVPDLQKLFQVISRLLHWNNTNPNILPPTHREASPEYCVPPHQQHWERTNGLGVSARLVRNALGYYVLNKQFFTLEFLLLHLLSLGLSHIFGFGTIATHWTEV
ncbi:hypothetical protein XELAEV_18028730mg [Xenopus laevis]|uniref:Uncharacterized protein n=1 Tax=Xenopus laevis TaxID=8355 RepID=A0A974CQY7_XENLA|nr:hypothetical protein XELAEV_18028730mg [Xenopus laevis]